MDKVFSKKLRHFKSSDFARGSSLQPRTQSPFTLLNQKRMLQTSIGTLGTIGNISGLSSGTITHLSMGISL